MNYSSTHITILHNSRIINDSKQEVQVQMHWPSKLIGHLIFILSWKLDLIIRTGRAQNLCDKTTWTSYLFPMLEIQIQLSDIYRLKPSGNDIDDIDKKRWYHVSTVVIVWFIICNWLHKQ